MRFQRRFSHDRSYNAQGRRRSDLLFSYQRVPRARETDLPAACPWFSLSGWVFSCAMNPRRSLAGKSFLARTPIGVSDSWPTCAKSVSGW